LHLFAHGKSIDQELPAEQLGRGIYMHRLT
jgi:hypothetical protein